MSPWEPPKTILDYLNRHGDLLPIYRKTGYCPYFERDSQKLGEKISHLEKTHRESIDDYSSLYKEILKGLLDNKILPIKELWDVSGLDFHTSDTFQDELEKYRERNPSGVSFIETFFEILAKLEGAYKSDANPLSERMKREVLQEIDLVKDGFIHGYSIEESVWKLQDILSCNFLPLLLEEDFGNKKEEFDSVIYAILNFYDWHSKMLKDNYKAKWDEGHVKNELLKGAKLYLESPWMYSPILTADLLQGIWLTYLLPLRHVRETIFPEKMVVISFLAILVIVYLFPSLKYLFYLWAGTFLFLLIQNWRMKKKANQLEILYSEISNEGYDGEEIAKRLYKLEDKGITFPSIVYPLLRLKHKPSKF